MKAHIANLPTLTSPKMGETLYLYLETSKECISAVLVAERERIQVPIYFVSRVLQGAEVNYPELEKLMLALVHTARKLRRYFQAHPIIVLTNKQIRQVLMKPEKSGRMAKWAIELGEHDIDFQARHSIKAQVLADFMAETTGTGEENNSTFAQIITPTVETKEWKLFTDGASSSDGSGEGLMLINPEGQEFTYALRFEFSTTNNEAEYEALLARLRIAKEMKIEHLQAFVDSQLVANQVIESFRSFIIEHVRRSQNKKADALSKLASITFAHLVKEVLVEVLEKRSIEAQEVHDLIIEEENTWMKPLKEYLELGILPEDKKEARKIRIKAPSYKIMNGALYRKSFLTPWLCCVGPNQASMIIREMHEGFCEKLQIKQTFTSVYHPQGNGQVEVTNRDILKGLEKCLGKCHQGWMEELPLVLWDHRTTPKRSNGETPYSLVYGTEAVLPAEIQVLTNRTANLEENEENLRLNLDLMEEREKLR
ncbi:uncharacterized protein [Rutidosis leptorrhynchoides]|uniref:uncharacterized protein n=1 Tax=Rutidosis leptorrhynchoides TaxID=125765 RepID=UPI003A9937C1